MRKLLLATSALLAGVALGVPGAAHATFVLDTSCGEAHCAGGTDFKNDSANHDVSTFTGTVGGHAGTAITVQRSGISIPGRVFRRSSRSKAAPSPI